jgi:hypothetical protein
MKPRCLGSIFSFVFLAFRSVSGFAVIARKVALIDRPRMLPADNHRHHPVFARFAKDGLFHIMYVLFPLAGPTS